MIHQPIGGAQGVQTEIEIQVNKFSENLLDNSDSRSQTLRNLFAWFRLDS